MPRTAVPENSVAVQETAALGLLKNLRLNFDPMRQLNLGALRQQALRGFIATIGLDSDDPADQAAAENYPKIKLAQCGGELCLELNEVVSANRLQVKLHWIDNRIFEVSFPQTQEPAVEAAGSPR